MGGGIERGSWGTHEFGGLERQPSQSEHERGTPEISGRPRPAFRRLLSGPNGQDLESQVAQNSTRLLGTSPGKKYILFVLNGNVIGAQKPKKQKKRLLLNCLV